MASSTKPFGKSDVHPSSIKILVTWIVIEIFPTPGHFQSPLRKIWKIRGTRESFPDTTCPISLPRGNDKMALIIKVIIFLRKQSILKLFVHLLRN